ncbi:hypothetical protein CI109_101895 [Kwoniella shandongensis]|uniref:NudC domain-containing protein 1 n=1 Tax=Kwoniella shandongensis TaxID=1734106 RepID=A0AAJ8LIM6_9TREE
MSHLFPPDRSLLLPQFETYRLHSLDPDQDVTFHPLPGPGATQSRVGWGQQHLSFKEVRARIGWDHLAVGEGGRGVYVDKDWTVVGFVIAEDLTPTFTKLASLPVPISSTEQQAEFPSVLSLTSTTWAISTGSGSLYILETTPPSDSTFSGSFIARYDLPSSSSSFSSSDSPEPSPFLLRGVHVVSPTEVILLVTRSVHPDGPGGRKKVSASQSTRFELLEVSLDPTRRNGVDDGNIELLDVKWILQGGDLPVWTTWSEGGWLVLSGEEFRSPSEIGSEQPSTEELENRERLERISKLGLGAKLPSSLSTTTDEPEAQADEPMQTEDEEDEKVYPYSWTQNSESINLTIPLPEETTRNDISIGLTPTTFSFSLTAPPTSLSPQLSAFLAKPTRQWWTNIDVSASTWTLDSAKHILELDIAKVDENTRWPSLFTPADDEDEDDEEDEVPETISASTLAAVRETFNNIKTRGPDEPEGMHPAMPALLREEMDFDLDDGEDFGESAEGTYAELGGGSKVGREVFVGYIKEDGQATWSKNTSSVISTPINSTAQKASVILKQAVDGVLFQHEKGDPTKTPWQHVATNPALAFVISSKRDLRLVRHLTTSTSTTTHEAKRARLDTPVQSTVLAFDSGSSTAGQGNLYVYYPPTSKTEAKQGVIGVSGGERGALLGVGAVQVGGRDVVVALLENELVVLRGVV